ncbi:hypothetical protein HN803_07150 [candidate division WWE3 bacterium]|jgi:hypothetical protein|nr:hypothetical protein [candidate division WWE3 bacterium]
MSKLGISIKLDVSKIDKSRLFKGAKGIYMDLTTFIDTEVEGQYGDHGFISQSVDKEERAAGVQTPILGNCKVFFVEGGAAAPTQTPVAAVNEGPNDDIPF